MALTLKVKTSLSSCYSEILISGQRVSECISSVGATRPVDTFTQTSHSRNHPDHLSTESSHGHGDSQARQSFFRRRNVHKSSFSWLFISVNAFYVSLSCTKLLITPPLTAVGVYTYVQLRDIETQTHTICYSDDYTIFLSWCNSLYSFIVIMLANISPVFQ